MATRGSTLAILIVCVLLATYVPCDLLIHCVKAQVEGFWRFEFSVAKKVRRL